MKSKILILVFLVLGKMLSAQDNLQSGFNSVAKYPDSVVVEIDKALFVSEQGYITNCNKLKQELQTPLQPYFKSINGAIPLYLISYKNIGDSIIVLTALREGKYSPILTLFTFDKDFNFVQTLDLESSFVDAGQVEIYKTLDFDQREFRRSFLTEWEKQIDGQGYTITDSTITTFKLSNSGIIQEINQEKHQRETKWR
ncbi:MAG: hypothetical protein H6587_03275 [Flavobacteriales bacterium]|nr:hypothetical protein [Flavobacteriales bacterium]MCB9363570.1 hypothetical protein [Flavobacteriales bacterium]